MANICPYCKSRRPPPRRPYIPRFATLYTDRKQIRNVWKYNLKREFKIIRQVIQRYKYVAIDTEYPGVVVKPQDGYMRFHEERTYITLKRNVDDLKLIQLGLSFFDEEGNTSKDEFGFSTWQFNFHYNLDIDLHAEDSIELLRESGLQFSKHRVDGIRHLSFGKLFLTSGVVFADNVKFITFHGCYDFAYLINILTKKDLPFEKQRFLAQLRRYFRTIYDVEQLIKGTNYLYGGLQHVADQLALRRVGTSHQAGSDALLTGNVFFAIKKLYFQDGLDDTVHSGYISGLTA